MGIAAPALAIELAAIAARLRLVGVRDLIVTGLTFSHIYKTTDSAGSWKDLTSLAASPM